MKEASVNNKHIYNVVIQKLNSKKLETILMKNACKSSVNTNIAAKTYQKGVPVNFWKIKLKQMAACKRKRSPVVAQEQASGAGVDDDLQEK
jgi:hypothetical protein